MKLLYPIKCLGARFHPEIRRMALKCLKKVRMCQLMNQRSRLKKRKKNTDANEVIKALFSIEERTKNWEIYK